MEKIEAIREWCMEKVIELYVSRAELPEYTTEDIIRAAKEFEKYIRDD